MTLDMNREQLNQLDKANLIELILLLQDQFVEQQGLITALQQQASEQQEQIQDLRNQLAKDSHNSSKPPSSDPPFKKPPPHSQRKPSGRKPGGQKGRRGVTRALVDEPDQRVIVPLTGTCDCGRCRTGIVAEVLPERRQVVELVIRREIT